MTQFYDSLKALISPEMISKASTLVEEKETNVSKAVSTIIPGLLGVFLKKGHSAQIKNILEEAGNLNIQSDAKSIFEEKPTQDQQKIGDDFLQHLLGDKAADFTAPVASHADISKVAANRLISMVAPVIAGFLGNQIVKEKKSISELLNEIGRQKKDFESAVPVGLIHSFDLQTNEHTPTTINNTNTTPPTPHHPENKPESQKSGSSWITWIILLVLLLVLFFWWKSCKGSKIESSSIQDTVIVIEEDTTGFTSTKP